MGYGKNIVKTRVELRTIISGVISNQPTSEGTKECIFLCRKIALVFLRKKMRMGRLHLDFSTIPLDDLALDCIADLFSRDSNGTLLQLKAYFEGLSIERLSDEELLTHLRRLVFSRVNQSIFRMYNEADPTLGKILRNTKLAIQSLQNFTTVERFGEQCIAPSMCDTLEHLPLIDRSEMEQCLREHANGSENIPTLLAKLSLALREQTERCRIIPVIAAAQLFRALYNHPHEEERQRTVEDHFLIDDAAAIIERACGNVQRENERQYVGKNKVEKYVYEKYFDVIQQNLAQRIINRDGEDFSFFDRLSAAMPALTKEEYHKQHKSKVEYLARLAYERAIKELKKNL